MGLNGCPCMLTHEFVHRMRTAILFQAVISIIKLLVAFNQQFRIKLS